MAVRAKGPVTVMDSSTRRIAHWTLRPPRHWAVAKQQVREAGGGRPFTPWSILDEYRTFFVFGEEKNRSVAVSMGSPANIQNMVKRG